METYFIRHTWKLNISAEMRAKMVDEGLVGFHFPFGPGPREGLPDVASLDPDDYERSGRLVLKRFHHLAASGGYVCAEFAGTPGWMLGKVPRGSKVELLYGHWREFPHRVAVMKVLRLSQIHRITEGAAAPMLVARPRMGTFMKWAKAGRSVMKLVEGITEAPTFDDLTADQQEVMCSEYLRSDYGRHGGLPHLSALVVPSGRTLKAVDIIGIAGDERAIFAQVTHSPLTSVQWKIDALRPFVGQGHCLLFCDTDTISSLDGIIIVPIRTVFAMWESTDLGKRWLEANFGKL
ncbi:MAG: hypothetical protein K8R88_01570 [Armatimonadetes bacterium]|nr:hypothetical protein [Armatimonadota bacterium]